MSSSLPSRPSLEHLKKQAKELLVAVKRNEPEAKARVAPYFKTEPSLTQAQLVVAREYGFPSWKALSRHIEGADGTLDEFMEAAFGGHVDKAKLLWRDHHAALRLHPGAAALAGDVSAVQAALKEDPTLANRPIGKDGRPLLCYACFSRLIMDQQFEKPILDTARALLDAGADPNGYYMAEWSGQMWRQLPIYGAAGVTNHAGMTKLLLDAGADPMELGGEDEKYMGEALYHSCEHPGHNECLRLLLEAGVSQPARDWCIMRKLDFEDQEGVLLFIEHGSNLNHPYPRTALGHALLRGRSVEMIRLLLDHGADPNVADADGMTPYVLARRFDMREHAKLLEERGASTDLEPYDQILVAAAEGDIDAVRRLAIEHPEAKSRVSEYGRQPADGLPLGSAGDLLHDMARLGKSEGLAALLDLGANPDTPNRWNETPLHWACVTGNIGVAKVLLDRGARLDVVEKNHGAQPFGWACWGSRYWHDPRGDYAGTVELMLAAGAKLPDRLEGSDQVQEILRRHGVRE